MKDMLHFVGEHLRKDDEHDPANWSFGYDADSGTLRGPLNRKSLRFYAIKRLNFLIIENRE